MILNILILILILIILFKSCKFKIEKFIILPKKKLPKKNTKSIKIPKKIWQTHKTNDLPQSSYDNINRLIRINPDFEYNYFDNDDCYQYIKKNFSDKVLKAYNKIYPGAGKADIWRLAVILKEGGIYIDVDKILRVNAKPFIDLIDKNDELIHGRGWFKWGYDAPATNATLCAVPNHPVIKMAFDSVIDSVINNKPITHLKDHSGWQKLEDYTGTPHLWKALTYYTENHNMKEGKFQHGICISNIIEKQLEQNPSYGKDLKELKVTHWMNQPVFNKKIEHFTN
jgi:mannosyltransferase OCH1-like enzyme